jgi:hypothetical protein
MREFIPLFHYLASQLIDCQGAIISQRFDADLTAGLPYKLYF